MKAHSQGKGLLALLLLILLSPYLLVWGVLRLLWTGLLYLMIWLKWGLRGRCVLLVTSDSPLWKDEIESKILPRLGKRAMVLNWSDRKKWKPSLAALAFMRFAGKRSFNPMAIVFRPLKRARVFRFYEAFKEQRDGKSERLEQLERDLFQTLDA